MHMDDDADPVVSTCSNPIIAIPRRDRKSELSLTETMSICTTEFSKETRHKMQTRYIAYSQSSRNNITNNYQLWEISAIVVWSKRLSRVLQRYGTPIPMLWPFT
jgi:hypothetical protein